MSMKTKLAAGAALGAVLMMAAPASATVFIGLQQAGVDGGAGVGNVATVASDPSSAIFAGSYGSFTVNTVSGNVGVNPDLLDSTSNNLVRTSTPGTLTIFVTSTDLTAPVGNLDWTSGFTANFVSQGWSVTESTYYDPSNGKFGGTLLSSETFGPGDPLGRHDHSLANPGPGPYSVTEEYVITAGGAGSALSTISLQAVPEPATWGLMLIGVGGLGAVLRRRNALARAAA